LQKLADETGLVIGVHHYPPGTSKWNKIEHRLFCHITQNWRGSLTDRLAVAELIGATTTRKVSASRRPKGGGGLRLRPAHAIRRSCGLV
jgi:hypothetical protein